MFFLFWSLESSLLIDSYYSSLSLSAVTLKPSQAAAQIEIPIIASAQAGFAMHILNVCARPRPAATANGSAAGRIIGLSSTYLFTAARAVSIAPALSNTFSFCSK